MQKKALDELKEVDRHMSASAPDLDVFMSFVSDEIAWFFCGRPPITSKEEVRAFYENIFKQPDFALTWRPNKIEMSNSRDMAYAYGRWEALSIDESGQAKKSSGYYATVWKNTDSGWKIVIEADY